MAYIGILVYVSWAPAYPFGRRELLAPAMAKNRRTMLQTCSTMSGVDRLSRTPPSSPLCTDPCSGHSIQDRPVSYPRPWLSFEFPLPQPGPAAFHLRSLFLCGVTVGSCSSSGRSITTLSSPVLRFYHHHLRFATPRRVHARSSRINLFNIIIPLAKGTPDPDRLHLSF